MRLIILISLIFSLVSCNTPNEETIQKIEMHFNPVGLETTLLPFIDATVDFSKETGVCKPSHYNSAQKLPVYIMKDIEVDSFIKLAKTINLHKLKEKYKSTRTDQASTTTTIYTNKTHYTIKDYGEAADQPLPRLYNIAYKPVIKKYLGK